MKDWLFPSFAFLVFLYGMFFLVLHVHNYSKSNANIFSDAPKEIKYDDINEFLKEISKSFK